MTPRTQKITSNSNGGWNSGENQVRIDLCPVAVVNIESSGFVVSRNHKKQERAEVPARGQARAGVKSLRIHDLRNFAASTLTGAGIEDNIISLLTGHKSRELRRYQHLREELKHKTVDLIAGVLNAAEMNGSGSSSSRLLHAAAKKTKNGLKEDS